METRQAAAGTGRRRAAAVFIYITVLLDVLALGIVAPVWPELIRGFEPVITRSWHRLGHPGLRDAVEEFLVGERAGILAYAEEARAALPYRQE